MYFNKDGMVITSNGYDLQPNAGNTAGQHLAMRQVSVIFKVQAHQI